MYDATQTARTRCGEDGDSAVSPGVVPKTPKCEIERDSKLDCKTGSKLQVVDADASDGGVYVRVCRVF